MMQPVVPHVPFEQVPPVPQDEPFTSLLQALVLADGWQLWHEFPGFGALAAKNMPPISQPIEHAPEWQISPDPDPPQAVPSD
jgi:hypothetical protein